MDVVEGLRIQVQNDLKSFTDENQITQGQTHNENIEALETNDIGMLNQTEDGSQLEPSGMNSDEEEGEVSSTVQDELMDVDADADNSPASDSPPNIVRSESPASDQESNSYTNHYFEGRKTRRYHNPYLKLDKDPNKLSSRASRFLGDDSFKNVEYNPEKLGSRAQRFGIEKSNSFEERPPLDIPTDEKLLDLYFSVGLIPDVGGKLSLDQVDPKSRLDSILIRGTNNMSTNEIFKYLHDNNVHPLEMEWVNDACCVVIYKDNSEAAATLLNITKPILIEPPRKKTVISGDQPEEDGEITDEEDDVDYHETDIVSSRLIKVPMPPGYVWRFAVPCQKATGILMRYANVNDRKQEKSERHSVYYKKHGNPNYGGVPAFFTASAKTGKTRKSSEKSDSEKTLPKTPIENKYAWSDLSAAWGEQERVEEMSKKGFKISPKQLRSGVQKVGPAIKSLKIQVNFTDTPSSVKLRLKRKRDHSSEDEADSPPVNNRRHHHRRSRAGSDDDSGDGMDWTKKIRGPVMRMHADEEEQRQRRRSKFRKVSSSSIHTALNTDDWRAARTMEIDRRPKRGSIKDRLGGFHAAAGLNPPNEEELELHSLESAGFRRHKVKRSLAERLGKRHNSPEDDDIFV